VTAPTLQSRESSAGAGLRTGRRGPMWPEPGHTAAVAGSEAELTGLIAAFWNGSPAAGGAVMDLSALIGLASGTGEPAGQCPPVFGLAAAGRS
jgi:hypothetical protein